MEFENTPDAGDNQNSDTPNLAASEQLVGEGKPFKDIEALAKGKLDADAFIEQLKAENAKMRDAVGESESKAQQAATLTQVLDAVRQMSGEVNQTPNEPAPAGEGGQDGNQPGLTEQDILKMVQRTLADTEANRKEQANYDSVRDAFQKKFRDADKARLSYKATAEALGISEEQLDAFAKANPEMVLRAAGLKNAFKSDQVPPSYLHTDKNSEHANQNAGDGPKNNKWWEAQRAQKGNKWYFDIATQKAYWEDVKALGDSFLEE